MADTDRLEDALASEFVHRYPEEAARAVDRMPAETAVGPIERLSTTRGVALLEALPLRAAAQVFPRLSEDRQRHLLSKMEPGRAVSLLHWFEPDVREHMLGLLPAGTSRELRGLAEYPFDSAGALMDPRVLSFQPDTPVGQVLSRLRVGRRRSGAVVWLVDASGCLLGTVALPDVAVAPLSQTVGALRRHRVHTVTVMATREEVAEQLEEQPGGSVAVVDLDGRLLGVIRPETLMSVVQEEAGADIQMMVGASREERVLSKVTFAVRKRLPWLHVNLGTAFLAAAVVGLFEDTIAQFTALAVLLPVVAGQSGNTGAQALAVTMRGLALREVSLRHWLRIIVKESNVALINGVAVALTTAGGVYVWSRSIGLSLVIALAMVISMLAAGLAGAVIPILLTAAGQDPAQASSIILTTVTDIVGFLSFLGLASLFAMAL